MCGVAGCFHGGGPFDDADRAALRAIQGALRHRGPDGEGFHEAPGCALAHRRLAVQDLTEAAAQPMVHSSGAALCYNGEIYNGAELRAQLAAKGHTFRGHGDTEVLLAACVEWGVGETILKLNGIFAFAFYDPRATEVHLVRDGAGVKPLYAGFDRAGRLWFSSELQPLVQSVDLDCSIDRAGLAAYAALGFVPAPETLFRGVRALQPGEHAIVGARGWSSRRVTQPEAPTAPSYSAAVAHTEELLTRAVERQLISDVPLGAFLSGGLDSSVISALVARKLRRELSTFSIGYADEPVIDESRWADLVARWLGTRHTLFTVSIDDARAVIEPALAAQGQPFGDPSLLPTYLVSGLARQTVTVALAGDGADELFAGYRKHLVESRRAALLRAPAPARAALKGLARVLPATRRHRWGEFVRQLRKFAAAAAAPADARWLALQSLLAPVERAHALYRAEMLDPAPLAQRVAQLVSGPGEGLDGVLRADFELVLPDRMLFKVDAASMAHGLEVRVPFLDRDVVHFVRACPADYKLKGGVRKRLLRDVGLPLLPPEMARRPKQGFDAPVGRWLAGPLREQFFDLIRGRRARLLLDVSAVERLHESLARGREAADAMLWSIFCLAHWAERTLFTAP